MEPNLLHLIPVIHNIIRKNTCDTLILCDAEKITVISKIICCIISNDCVFDGLTYYLKHKITLVDEKQFKFSDYGHDINIEYIG